MTVAPIDRMSEAELQEAVRTLAGNEEILLERLADLELALEDRGWEQLAVQLATEFSRDGLKRAADVCRMMSIVNPLIKRGLTVRKAYVFGQGVEISTEFPEDFDSSVAEDLARIVQNFWDDTSNVRSFTGSQAQGELEWTNGTDGNVFLACFTTRKPEPRVEVRSIPFDEIVDVIRNPQDRDEPWFYKRQWYENGLQEVGVDGSFLTVRTLKTEYYPDLFYNPTRKPRTINGNPVIWDAPIYHVAVNKLDGWKFGIGDAYASIFWARGYKEFLEDWARLVKALSRFAWKAQAKSKSAAQNARAQIATRPNLDPATGRALETGATAVMTDDIDLVAIPKSGATIDSESGKPLAAMVAAGLGVPLTQILADPGTTGARAVAETLEPAQVYEMGERRQVWATAYVAVIRYTLGVHLGGMDRIPEELTVSVNFPGLTDEAMKDLVESIVKAASTNVIPPLVLLRELLKALRVEDIDKIIKKSTDAEGNFISPTMSVAQAAVNAYRRGEDPADTL